MAILSDYSRVYVLLNKEKILEIIRGQDLKQYWVAEMAGIHKTTLRRWLSGRIARVKEENVKSLAAVLSTPPERLILN